MVGVPGAKHLWVGDAETVLDEIVKRVAPEAYPLPREWDGPMTSGDASAYADRTLAAFPTCRRRAEPPCRPAGSAGQPADHTCRWRQASTQVGSPRVGSPVPARSGDLMAGGLSERPPGHKILRAGP